MDSWNDDQYDTPDTQTDAALPESDAADYPTTDPYTDGTYPTDPGYPADGGGDASSASAATSFSGLLSTGVPYTVLDDDGDAHPDTVLIDLDGDGFADLTVERSGGDFHVTGGDIDEYVPITALRSEMPEVYALFGDLADPTADELIDIQDGEIIGDPFEASRTWFEQSFNGSCVPASVAQILSEYLGVQPDDQHFVDDVNALGLWNVAPDGTPSLSLEDAQTIFASEGIPTTQTVSDVDGLTTALAEGYRPLVYVDSGKYWEVDDTDGDGADHAVTVTGINLDEGVVYLNDTGTDTGEALRVSIDDFEAAWAQSGNTMLVCDQTPEEFQEDQRELRLEEAGLPAGDEGLDEPATDAPPLDEPDATTAGSDTGAGEANPVIDVLTDAGTDGSAAEPVDSPLDDVLSGTVPQPNLISTVVHTAPWILLPIVLGAGAAAAAVARKR
ncbi:cysteine peptidase family C39 domain-containing protein [Herbiconiux daphne]|uniref:Peptidase C39-like domain-containing protein n=1 Tax=Herbiconiux daphne TaxID=2970914 RepID=A0ABT2GXG1_9MICO|nr:hypothetical protein [Herbiconiux daphne]MCS5732651.1 hypothetical protein [Herbiconiux daphne]